MTHDRARASALTRRAALLAALALVLATGAGLAQGAADESAPADSAAAGPASIDETAPLHEPAAAPSDTASPVRYGLMNDRLTTVRKVRLDLRARNVVRSGPGDSYSIVGVYPKGMTFPVIAKSGEWYDIRVSDSETGWVHSSLVREFDDLADLEWRPNPMLYSRTGSYVLGAYTGGYSFDRKSNSLVVGGRVGYYVFDRFQAEAAVSWTHVHRPAEIVESLFGLSLEAEDFPMLFYSLNVLWEVLPGRQMVPFVAVGAGSAIMQGETESSVDVGAGTLLFFSKRLATRWEVRGYRFDSGSASARRRNTNIEFTLGTSILF